MERPDFAEEKKLWKKGYRVVIGMDEAGRGAFAGPVTVGAVCFSSIETPPRSNRSHRSQASVYTKRNDRSPLCHVGELERYLREIGVNDSKVLRPRKREELVSEIKKLPLGFAVASSSVGEINRLGIKKATERAFRRAVIKLKTQSSKLKATTKNSKLNREFFVLSDAFHIRYLKGIGLKNQKAIKKGDKRSLSIAAASILAKVHRDLLMKKLSRRSSRYRKYGWAKNKGYGTQEHCYAILRYGLTRLHRRDFVATFLANERFSSRLKIKARKK